VTDHITGVLEKLTMKERYYGGDQVHTASGAGIEIKHIGRSIVHTPNQDLLLNNVLYVPQAKKNLASIHKLAYDNNAFFEFHPWYFFIKDRATRILLWGRRAGGLYPLKSISNKRVFGVTNPSTSRWQSFWSSFFFSCSSDP
jgi:hypothetical protein